MTKVVNEQAHKVEYGMTREKADTVAKCAGSALGFSIPVSTALDSILGISVVGFWVLGARYRKKWGLIRENPVAMVSLAMFGLLVLGGFYSDASWDEVFKVLGKYSDLVLLSLLIPLFQDGQMRRNGLGAFFLTMVVVLLLSYLISFGVLPRRLYLGYLWVYFKGSEVNSVVFRSHITHNLLVAFSAFAFATFARIAKSLRRRMLWVALAVMAVFNLLFMVKGRTGYLVLGILVIYFFADWLRWKGIVIAIVGGSVIVVSSLFLSNVFHARLSLTAAEFHKWSSGQVPALRAGSGEGGLWLRLAYYQKSLAIVQESPVFGVGTGGFAPAFAEKVKDSPVPATSHPHNEYLLIAVQVGLVGLGGLLYLFYTQWRLAADLPGLLERNLARGLVLTVMTTCLINSSLLDHGEGIFYAWMSGLLFAGLNSRGEKSREAIQCPFWKS